MENDSLEVRLEEQMDRMYREHWRTIYYYILRHARCTEAEAEDLTEDVFIRTWRRLKEEVIIEAPENWLVTAAKNACIRYQQYPKFGAISGRPCISIDGEENPLCKQRDPNRNNEPDQ